MASSKGRSQPGFTRARTRYRMISAYKKTGDPGEPPRQGGLGGCITPRPSPHSTIKSIFEKLAAHLPNGVGCI
jgi:hypothetical protein